MDPNSINNQTQLKQLLAYVKQMEDSAFNQQFSGIMKNRTFLKKKVMLYHLNKKEVLQKK
jgi:hypothetical protein